MASQPLPERYVQLGLRLGKHVDGLVDGYYGPRELKDAVDAEPLADPDDLRAESVALLDEVADWDEPDAQRRRWLTAQVEGLVCAAELVGGAEVPWQQAVCRCYGIEVGPVPQDGFAAAHELLDAALPGDGPLAERLQAWHRSQEVPSELLLPALDALVEVLREETEKILDLPDGERIDRETVTGEPWAAYNWYLGDRKSRIQVATDLPIRSYVLAGLVAHEGYPGHHTEHACKEARLLDELGRIEHSILLIHTPECLVSEGIAQVAVEQALGDDWPARAAAILGPLGVPFDADTARAVVDAFQLLDDLPSNVAYYVSEEGWTEEQAVAYHRRWTLSEEDRARKSVGFATHPVWGIYVPTYAHGYRMVRSAGLPFRRLLTEPITTADLLDTSAA